MSNPFKTTWLIILLIAAGGVLLFLSFQTGQTRREPAENIQKADPVPPMGVVTSPENGHEAGFAIQVYSFQDKNRAYAALGALKNRGYQAFIVVSDLGEKGRWYRVRVGNIADESAVQKMLGDIRRNYNSGFILNSKS